MPGQTKRLNPSDFTGWLDDLCSNKFKPGKFYLILPEEPSPKNQEVSEFKVRARLFTEKYQYNLTAIDRYNNSGYLGGTVSCRAPRPGEDWLRGSDLPDGPFNRDTWISILNAIIGNELLELEGLPVSMSRRSEENTNG